MPESKLFVNDSDKRTYKYFVSYECARCDKFMGYSFFNDSFGDCNIECDDYVVICPECSGKMIHSEAFEI